jgi:hypothetical protein
LDERRIRIAQPLDGTSSDELIAPTRWDGGMVTRR